MHKFWVIKKVVLKWAKRLVTKWLGILKVVWVVRWVEVF